MFLHLDNFWYQFRNKFQTFSLFSYGYLRMAPFEVTMYDMGRPHSNLFAFPLFLIVIKQYASCKDVYRPKKR